MDANIRKSYASDMYGYEEASIKIPLSSISRRTSAPSTPLPPKPKPLKNFGIKGTFGFILSIIFFTFDILSDILLTWSLWDQAENNHAYYIQKRLWRRFYITLGIVCVPLVVVNIVSIILYIRTKTRSDGRNVFFNNGKCQRTICVFLHLILMGLFVRYCDIIQYGRNLLRGTRYYSRNKRSEQPTEDQDEEFVMQAMTDMKSFSMDVGAVDILYTYTKTAVQLLYQTFLLYRSHVVFEEDIGGWEKTIIAQVTKIVICLLYITWSHVAYQEEVRRRDLNDQQLKWSAVFICLGWRLGTISSRILAIASFAALKPNKDGGVVKVDNYRETELHELMFPMITLGILLMHWLLMVIWAHSQKRNWCIGADGEKQHCTELSFSLLIGYVQIFCYLNMERSLTRKRMIFYFIIILLENTTMMTLWYMQLISVDMWLKVTILISVEILFIIGVSCAVGYYAFNHPVSITRP